jgi:hypothetical protein
VIPLSIIGGVSPAGCRPAGEVILRPQSYSGQDRNSPGWRTFFLWVLRRAKARTIVIFTVFGLQIDNRQPERFKDGSHGQMHARSGITLRELRRAKGLEGISLGVAPGEIMVIIGPNSASRPRSSGHSADHPRIPGCGTAGAET